jgi:hypothetical protein
MNHNECIVCGDIIPEGRQVCMKCEYYYEGYITGVQDFANRIRERDRTWSISEIEKELLEERDVNNDTV